MTDEEFKAWSADPQAVRCLLVEAVANVNGVETTRYMSNLGYVTSASDTPANTTYMPIIVGGVSVSESLPLTGRSAMSWGDVEIANFNGEVDTWLDDVWSGRSVSIWFGDPRWPRSEFRRVFSGLVEDITSRSSDKVNLLLRDKSQKLNTAISEATLDNASVNADTLKPLCFGEVHNITPVLIDAGTLTYMVHNGPIESIIEVRDNGIPVSVGTNLTAGTFTLTAAPVGTITASVQGSKAGGVYRNTVGELVQHIATTYGTTPLTLGDIDTVQIAAFDAAHPQPVGVFIGSRENLLDTLQKLAASVGAQVALTPSGLLRLLRVSLPPQGTPEAVTSSNFLLSTLAVSSTPAVQACVALNYCKNYTVQSGLTTGLPAAHTSLYGQEWLVSQAKNQTLADTWNLQVSVDPVDTLLQTRTAADAEASRRLAMWGARRQVLKFDSVGQGVAQTLGGAVTITHNRFGLAAGKVGQVIGKKTDWMSQKVSYEVLV